MVSNRQVKSLEGISRNACASRAWKGDEMSFGRYAIESCLALCCFYISYPFLLLITPCNSIFPIALFEKRLSLGIDHETRANWIDTVGWLWPCGNEQSI